MKNKRIKGGTILLAEPFMLDPNFKRAAILVVDHHEEGSLGFILNRPSDLNVDELIETFPEFGGKVRIGGPVGSDTIHYIHSVGDLLEDSHEIAQGIYWGGDFEKLKFLIDQKVVSKDQVRFFLGYTGWGPGQLSDELNIGSWVMANMDSNYVFNVEASHIWGMAMAHKGSSYSVIANMPEVVSWN